MTPKRIVTATTLAFLLAAGAANAQATTTVGTPNTGTGGNAADNVLLMTSSAAVAVLAALYMLRARRA